jgi:hypothetical protein
MNKHLNSVRALHEAGSFPQAEQGANRRLSDMDIILRQALLMEGGSEVLKALKAGEMTRILLGLVDLAYYALSAIALQGAEVTDRPVAWRHDGSVISIMRLLSDKINHCAAGGAENYSDVYGVCVHLTGSFLNADFDKAFQVVHGSYMSRLAENGGSAFDDAGKMRKSKLFKEGDLNECLFE